MSQHYHHWLVLVSLLVAILASYTALTLALRIRVSDRHRGPAWLVGGGVAMGIGIWSMHFVGMLALRLPIEIAYDVRITALSMLRVASSSTSQSSFAGSFTSVMWNMAARRAVPSIRSTTLSSCDTSRWMSSLSIGVTNDLSMRLITSRVMLSA